MTSLFQIDLFAMILKGILIGIIASAPMGPVGILCIQRTLNKGRWLVRNGCGRCYQRHHLRYDNGIRHVFCCRLYQQSEIQILSSDWWFPDAVVLRHLHLHDEAQETDSQERQAERYALAQWDNSLPRDVQQSAHHLPLHVDLCAFRIRHSPSSARDDSRLRQHYLWSPPVVVRTDMACRQNSQQVRRNGNIDYQPHHWHTGGNFLARVHHRNGVQPLSVAVVLKQIIL